MKPFIKTFTHQVEPRGHCATICPHKKGILLAYYNGPECTDAQAVNIEYWENDKKIIHTKLPNLTGNCILWAKSKDEAGLIFSLFEDTDGTNKPKVPVQRWMFCSNWQVMLNVNDTEIEGSAADKIPLIIGHLVRCQPILHNNIWYLPMYREFNCKGIVMKSSDGQSWKFAGTIGEDLDEESGRFGYGVLIQPTIWHDGTKFHSLSRDVSTKHRAWYASSKNCVTWTKPITTNLSNYNNSVVAIHDGSPQPWIVWNHGPHRMQLVLGKWNQETKDAKPILKLNTKSNASYPNYCHDLDGNLQIVHTDGYVISRHILNQAMLDKLATEPQLRNIESIEEWELVSK